MLTAGSTARLAEVRDLAHDSGAICVGSVVDLQLANVGAWAPLVAQAVRWISLASVPRQSTAGHRN